MQKDAERKGGVRNEKKEVTIQRIGKGLRVREQKLIETSKCASPPKDALKNVGFMAFVVLRPRFFKCVCPINITQFINIELAFMEIFFRMVTCTVLLIGVS